MLNYKLVGDSIVIIPTRSEWRKYVADLNHQFGKVRQFGIPTKLPCLVITITDSDNETTCIEHRFVYPETAEMLLEIDKEVNSRIFMIFDEP